MNARHHIIEGRDSLWSITQWECVEPIGSSTIHKGEVVDIVQMTDGSFDIPGRLAYPMSQRTLDRHFVRRWS